MTTTNPSAFLWGRAARTAGAWVLALTLVAALAVLGVGWLGVPRGVRLGVVGAATLAYVAVPIAAGRGKSYRVTGLAFVFGIAGWAAVLALAFLGPTDAAAGP